MRVGECRSTSPRWLGYAPRWNESSAFWLRAMNPAMRLVLACVFVFGPTSGVQTVSGVDGRQQPTSRVPLHWRDSLACGQTSCYVFLKLWGVPVSLESIRSVIPVVPELGTNLADMAHGCRQLGLEVDVVRSAPSELERVPLPAIAHVARAIAAPQNGGAAPKMVGHFVVVVGMDEHEMEVIDASASVGTSPLLHMNRGTFFRQWTGELLVRHQENTRSWTDKLSVLLPSATFVAFITLWCVTRRRDVRAPFGKALIAHEKAQASTTGD
jgi:hypothetical protein